MGTRAFRRCRREARTLVYYAFDALWVEGKLLLDQPLTLRKERLESLLDRRSQAVRLSESFDDGVALMEAARQQHLEGVVAKKTNSVYVPGKRTREWLKVKTEERQEFLIVGYTKGQGRRASSLGALVLAVRSGGDLVWVGNCGTGFDEQEIQKLLRKLRPLERKTSPFKVVQDAQGPEGRCRVGDAQARLRGPLQRMDP